MCGIHDMDCDDDESDGHSGVRGCIILFRGGGGMYIQRRRCYVYTEGEVLCICISAVACAYTAGHKHHIQRRYNTNITHIIPHRTVQE